MKDRLFRWLQQNRTSTRLGVALQAGLRIASSLLALVWTPLFLQALGPARYGLLLSFQSVAALGGLGDLGLGGAVAIQVGRQLGAGEAEELQRFLATVRGTFLWLVLAGAGGFLGLSPFLPGWLGFQPVAGAGSLSLLFVVGGFSIGLLIVSSYVNNLNYAALNLNWQALPTFAIGQGFTLLHCWLAFLQAPLWQQQLTAVGSSVCMLFVGWWVLRRTQPSLARLFPISLEGKVVRSLLADGVWVYLIALGGFVFWSADRLLINGGIDPALVPVYQFNNKLCELALLMVTNLTFVAMPKLALWLHSSLEEERRRLEVEAQRLNLAESLLGLAAALVYLLVNDAFVRLWLGSAMQAPLGWQVAFAASLAVTVGSNAGIQLTSRLGARGLPFAGAVIGLCALLNLGLSWVAMRSGSIVGIAVATVASQSLMSLAISRYLCGRLSLAWWRWAFRSCLVPLVVVGIAGFARTTLSWAGAVALLGVLWLAAAWGLGLRWADLRAEWSIWRGMFGARR